MKPVCGSFVDFFCQRVYNVYPVIRMKEQVETGSSNIGQIEFDELIAEIRW